MRQSLRQRCELLADNYTVIHHDFMWDFEMMSLAAACIYTSSGIKADTAKMKECQAILKKKEGVFSELRGTTELALLSRMAVSNSPENYLEEVLGVYKRIMKGKIFSSPYYVLSALIIVEQHKVGQADDIISKTNDIIKKMGKEHPLLTGREDVPFATIMAMLPDEVSSMIHEMEACYDVLKKKFPMHKDAVQGLCQVLTISKMDNDEKSRKAVEIFESLKKKGIKYGKSTELAALGGLVDINMDADAIASEVAEASELLKKHKGFGNIALGKEYRAMFAALMVAEDYAGFGSSAGATALGSSLAVAIAEEIILLILIAAQASATAANTAAHS